MASKRPSLDKPPTAYFSKEEIKEASFSVLPSILDTDKKLISKKPDFEPQSSSLESGLHSDARSKPASSAARSATAKAKQQATEADSKNSTKRAKKNRPKPKGKDPTFSKPHAQKVYELSEKIWGTSWLTAEEQKAAELEERWRELEILPLEVFVEHTKLLSDQASLILEALLRRKLTIIDVNQHFW